MRTHIHSGVSITTNILTNLDLEELSHDQENLLSSCMRLGISYSGLKIDEHHEQLKRNNIKITLP